MDANSRVREVATTISVADRNLPSEIATTVTQQFSVEVPVLQETRNCVVAVNLVEAHTCSAALQDYHLT